VSIPNFFAADAYERAYATGALYELEKAQVTFAIQSAGWGSGACARDDTGCFGALVAISNENPQHGATFEPRAFTASYSYRGTDSKGHTTTEYASTRASIADALPSNATTGVLLAFDPGERDSRVYALEYEQPWIDAPLRASVP